MRATIRYTAKAWNYGLLFRKQNNIEDTKLVANCDADWPNDVRDRKSIMETYVTYKDWKIGWTSRKQTAVSQSTAEAEYLATVDALQCAVFAQKLAQSLPGKAPEITMENDDQPSVDIFGALGATKKVKIHRLETSDDKGCNKNQEYTSTIQTVSRCDSRYTNKSTGTATKLNKSKVH